jgi:3-hydroxybutyryl-CoA dehydrogenase
MSTIVRQCLAPEVKPNVTVEVRGESSSFPRGEGLPDQVDGLNIPVRVILGNAATLPSETAGEVIAIELGLECLGVHTGESRGEEGSGVVGFARFRLGSGNPSDLVELVRQANTDAAAVEAVARVFRAAGLEVAVCGDVPGRILDRLIRPYLNVALTSLDEGLATAADIDQTVRMGLGYPQGPIELAETTGLADHYRVSRTLFEALGGAELLPARRAQVAHERAQRRRG